MYVHVHVFYLHVHVYLFEMHVHTRLLLGPLSKPMVDLQLCMYTCTDVQHVEHIWRDMSMVTESSYM